MRIKHKQIFYTECSVNINLVKYRHCQRWRCPEIHTLFNIYVSNLKWRLLYSF